MACIFLVTTTLTSCRRTAVPKDIQYLINLHPHNRENLTKAIENYRSSADTLKLKALCFVLRSLDNRSYYEGNNLRKYVNYTKLIRLDYNSGDYVWNSFNVLYGPFSRDSLIKNSCLDNITAQQLTTDIDQSYKTWKDEPWDVHYSFDDFCEYILPFRIDDEYPDLSRADISKRFSHLIDSLRTVKADPVTVCTAVNNKLITDGWTFTQRLSLLPHFSPYTLITYRTGSCRDMSDYATYVMRSIGLPIGNDFVPQWLHRPNGHNWDVELTPDGRTIPFMGAESNPGTPVKPRLRRGKIYRHTFGVYNKSLGAITKNKQSVPGFLRDPCIKDVTGEYFRTFSLPITLNLSKEKYIYLSIFNTVEWYLVDWAFVENQKARFHNLEGDIVYLPTFYEHEKSIPAADPIYLDSVGEVKIMHADRLKPIKSMLVKRTFPDNPEDFLINYTVGGSFQAANRSDFSDAVNLTKFDLPVLPGWNTLKLKQRKSYHTKFRYIRYLAPRRYPTYGSLSEVQIISGGKQIGYLVRPHFNLENFKANTLSDHDFSTFYTLMEPGSWVTFDLQTASEIDEIKFATGMVRNKDTYIQQGHTYQLDFWADGRWNQADIKPAISDSIVFNNIPSNAIYLLTDRTTKSKHQMFRYQKQQLW